MANVQVIFYIERAIERKRKFEQHPEKHTYTAEV